MRDGHFLTPATSVACILNSMDSAGRLSPRADLRVGDADRRDVVVQLERHFIDGRLDSDELGERVAQSLAARTFGDLTPILADLPPLPEAAPGDLALPHGNRSAGLPWLLLALIFTLLSFAGPLRAGAVPARMSGRQAVIYQAGGFPGYRYPRYMPAQLQRRPPASSAGR